MRKVLEALIATAAVACAGSTSSGTDHRDSAPVVVVPPTLAATFVPAPATALGDPTPQPEAPASISVGRPNRGSLINGVLMEDGPAWVVVNPKRAFATAETIASITAAVRAVNAAFPDSPKLYVGDMSAEHGGYIRPHHSHQSGRDVDLGLYYTKGPAWFVRARADNLDVARSWELVKTLIFDPNVEIVFVDRSIQRLLKAYALDKGETRERLEAWFDERSAFSDRVVRHEWGHLTHLHVRFKSPAAVAAGERVASALALHRTAPLRERLVDR